MLPWCENGTSGSRPRATDAGIKRSDVADRKDPIHKPEKQTDAGTHTGDKKNPVWCRTAALTKDGCQRTGMAVCCEHLLRKRAGCCPRATDTAIRHSALQGVETFPWKVGSL